MSEPTSPKRVRARNFPAVRPYMRPPRLRRWFAALVRHAALWIGAAWGSAALLDRAPVAGAVGYVLALFVIGSRFRAIGNMVHETCHRTLVRGARANVILGHLLSFVDFTDYETYCRDHHSHHRHLGDPERDLDFRPRKRLFDAPGSVAWKHVVRPLLLLHVPSYIDPVIYRAADPPWVRGARVAYTTGLLALGGLVIGWNHLLLYYLIPYVTTYQMFRYWSDAADHAGIIERPDPFERARNHDLPLLNWLLFPHNDQFHLVHHLYPAVPTTNLALVHDVLMVDPEYAQRHHALLPRA
jgi:fatty acid desaturase